MRIVERAVDRQIDLDLAALIFQQRHGQQYRQLGRIRTFDPVAEGKLIEEDLVLRVQGAVLDVVADVERELALGDAVTGILLGVGAERGQLDVLAARLHVDQQIAAQGIDGPVDRHRRTAVVTALEHDARPAPRIRGKPGHAAGDLAQVRAVVGLDVVVGKLDASVGQDHLVDPYLRCGARIGLRGRGGGR